MELNNPHFWCSVLFGFYNEYEFSSVWVHSLQRRRRLRKAQCITLKTALSVKVLKSLQVLTIDVVGTMLIHDFQHLAKTQTIEF